MQLPLRIPLQPSRTLACLLIVAHGLALIVVTVTALALQAQDTTAMPPMLLWALLPLIAFSWARAWMHSLGRRRCIALNLQSDGRLEYHGHDGSVETVSVESDSTVMPWLVVLLLRSGSGRRMSLVLLPDAMAADHFRRLRLWLRWRAISATR